MNKLQPSQATKRSMRQLYIAACNARFSGLSLT